LAYPQPDYTYLLRFISSTYHFIFDPLINGSMDQFFNPNDIRRRRRSRAVLPLEVAQVRPRRLWRHLRLLEWDNDCRIVVALNAQPGWATAKFLFLASHTSRQGHWNNYRPFLPADVLKKVYQENAFKLLATVR
jgi:hypothetical protein